MQVSKLKKNHQFGSYSRDYLSQGNERWDPKISETDRQATQLASSGKPSVKPHASSWKAWMNKKLTRAANKWIKPSSTQSPKKQQEA